VGAEAAEVAEVEEEAATPGEEASPVGEAEVEKLRAEEGAAVQAQTAELAEAEAAAAAEEEC
jgi:hypothetical protein